MRPRAGMATIALAAVMSTAASAAAGPDGSAPIEIELRDGTTVHVAVVESVDDVVVLVTDLGVRMEIPATAIVRGLPALQRAAATEEATAARRKRLGSDPTSSRLMLAPTGRPLRKGYGYYSDHFFFFPAVSYGVTNHVSVLGGMSVFPGVGLVDQLRYIAPRYGTNLSDRTSVSVGSFIGSGGSGDDGGMAGIAFAMLTHGDREMSGTVGLGVGFARENGREMKFLNGPIIGLGLHRRLGDHTAFVSEGWLITGEGVNLSEQPFGVAVRFFSGNLSVDVGALLIYEVLKEGFPIPWLSFAYHFGS